jgi:hypothetical protein
MEFIMNFNRTLLIILFIVSDLFFFWNCYRWGIFYMTEVKNFCCYLCWEIFVISWKSCNEKKIYSLGKVIQNFSKYWVSSCEYGIRNSSFSILFSYAKAISPWWPDTDPANTIHNENQCHQVTKQSLRLL